jgi:hypothetical protein
MLVLALALALAAPATADAARPKRQFYVSLGDSYATGFQPSIVDQAVGTRNGFAYQLPGLAKRRGYRFKLVNFGCGSETTATLLERTARCAGPGPGRRRLRRQDADRRRRALPAREPTQGRPGHGLGRRQRRDPLRKRAESDRVRHGRRDRDR